MGSGKEFEIEKQKRSTPQIGINRAPCKCFPKCPIITVQELFELKGSMDQQTNKS